MNSPAGIRTLVTDIVQATPVFDIHTHLYDPAFGELLLWGIDDLLTYHYLIAEGFRQSDVPYEKFWALSKTQQADLIWDALFLRHSPVSEACRGVLTVLQALGLDVRKRDLPALRAHFAQWEVGEFTTRCLELARVRQVCMTNSPFDPLERPVWERGFARDPRFAAALRIDPLLLDWANTAPQLHAWGYEVRADFSGQTFGEVRRFLADWTRRIDARYCMVSLPADFAFPAETPEARLIEHAILPHGREHGQAFALMIGVKRSVNPQLRMAGDGVGLAEIGAVENLCAQFPANKFLVTMLARENQHALCVAARKFRNLHVFGCWWFLNNPSIIEDMTRMRLEMLGLSMTPQHSDCRVLDQLVYKWSHSRGIIGRVLAEKYADLAATGWEPTRAEIERDVHDLFGGALERFLKD
ncbi:MAG: glucuronate isomerase [Verrucomicrobia bacterium]|nr:MAG: glucuronate isomerase [Verrucomicrobiota bacterium]